MDYNLCNALQISGNWNLSIRRINMKFVFCDKDLTFVV
jgi:hypothetical protein